MRGRSRVLALAGALLGTAALSAKGTRADEAWHTGPSIGPRAAFYRFSDAERGVWGRGAQARLRIGPAAALEGSVDWVHYASQGSSVYAAPLQMTLLGFLTPGAPQSFFLLIGGGWYPARSDESWVSTHRRFGPHAGAGFDLMFSRRFSVSGSYRFLWTQVNRLSDPLHLLGRQFRQRGSMFTIGLDYHL